MSAALLEFDETGRTSAPLGTDAPSAIANALRNQGIDAPGSLYNESLNLAREGLLGPASQRLQMLICLDPSDADAHLLLCKVYAAQGRPSDALARLAAATEAGAVSPAGLREHLEALIRTDRQKDEEHRARIAAREQGEIKALRQEARNLRSETIRLEAEVTESQDRAKVWQGTAALAAMATAATVITIGMVMFFSARDGAASGVTTDVAEPAAAVAPPPVPAEILALQQAAPKPAAAPPLPSAVGSSPVQPAPTPTAVKVPVAASAVAIKLPTTHVVVSGDSLYSLAGKYYGDKMEFKKISAANKAQLGGGIALKLGMKLTIPK